MSERLIILDKSQTEVEGLFDGSQKLLQILTAENHAGSEFHEFVAPVGNMAIGNDARFAYSSQVLHPYEREHWWIPMDHCYARPWNWRPESTFLRPTKTLFVPKSSVNKRKSTNPLAPVQDCEEIIDIVTDSQEDTITYDKAKAKYLMEECERHAALARVEDFDEDWEEKITRSSWSPTQSRLFNSMVHILNMDNLARLAHTNSQNEPVVRRVTIDKSVERVRRLMATVSWDSKYSQWLHQTLIDNLSTQYLASYLDILQTLRSKLPSFVDKMMTGTNASRVGFLGYENLFPLIKRPWDPIAQSLMQDKPKKLPGSPVIVVVPSTPISSKRMLKWINLLSNLATVITIPSNYGGGPGHKTAMMNCVDQMFVMTRNRIQDIRLDYPGRNIILVGFGFGATLALQIAQVEQVLCVVSIGFSLLTAEGRRGDPDDNLLELQCPVLFVVGQCSNTSSQEDMEDLRERMRVETGLIIVGSADDNLRMSIKKKKTEGITQSIVDRRIADEVGEFISGIILSPYPPQIRQSPTNLTTDGTVTKKMKPERKRYNSNTSSVDSEPPSPTPRITRPGLNYSSNLGRPPGSKSKIKLETKWTAQGTTSSPSNSPPHPPTLHTPDASSNGSNTIDKVPNNDTFPTKKIKTLKPTIITHDKITSSTNQHSNSAKVVGLQNRTLPGLLQTDIQTIIQPTMMKPGASGIKVLENVKLSGSFSPKVFTNNPKILDIPKVASGSSLVLLPDGKIKNLGVNVKIPGGRYITSKRQLLGNKTPKLAKKNLYLPQMSSTQTTNLLPPTNLTTQDILDLPIIFADDNQILDNTIGQSEIKSVSPIVTASSIPKFLPPTTGNKFMVLNKPQNFIITSSSKGMNSSQSQKMQPKYTKIILSSKKGSEQSSVVNVTKKISPEISVTKLTPEISPSPSVPAELDLENEIVANTLYKRKVDGGATECLEILSGKPEESLELSSSKRTAKEAEILVTEAEAVPSKMLKLDRP